MLIARSRQATESVIAFLSLDERQRAKLANRLTSVWPQVARLQSEILHPMMPFQPLSCRDFMLYERHAIDAARGYAKRFIPMAYRVARLYEVASRRPFPAFRPGMLWYAQPLYYMGNHLSFLPSEAVVPWPRYTQALDYELELGVVLVRPLFNATPEEAEQAIGGFTVFNDFSARDVQLAEMRSGFGPCKAKHFANVISDVVVTADAVMAMVYSRKARVRINGKTAWKRPRRVPAMTSLQPSPTPRARNACIPVSSLAAAPCREAVPSRTDVGLSRAIRLSARSKA